ncbi:MAG TPA: cytochrome C oxidase subunit II [Bradyrhizobium sp.]|jgi:cytochrome c oxidase subunit 2|nr:cytochrome C oxidase subunit II [Bradyrhizobium sp.]
MTAPSDDGVDSAERVEHRWAALSVAIMVLLVAMATFAAVYHAAMPQARVETVDPRTLHLGGEFIESNLGSTLEPDGSVTLRGIGQQYSFTPSCMVLPTNTLITLRATSADVVHGFLIDGTNINLMLVPGYVSSLNARFDTPGERLMPCHEFCGMGHEGMWGRIKVIDKAAFARLAADRRRLSCVE